MNLLSERVIVPAAQLPPASEDAVKSEEQRDGQKYAGGKAMPPVAAPVSVESVRAEVRAMEAIGIPERPEDETKDQ